MPGEAILRRPFHKRPDLRRSDEAGSPPFIGAFLIVIGICREWLDPAAKNISTESPIHEAELLEQAGSPAGASKSFASEFTIETERLWADGWIITPQ